MSNRRGPGQPYSLYGVLVHSGHSVHSGHYFAFVKAPNGLWHQLDDNHVSQVSFQPRSSMCLPSGGLGPGGLGPGGCGGGQGGEGKCIYMLPPCACFATMTVAVQLGNCTMLMISCLYWHCHCD